ncbi:unnamed protein product [Rotaria sordida]|uniref:Uncharacterized protein n=2 Tax=Rotaria sordida TaxID=392033 RepID=A0A814E580_9BILA|nr:unnamed protein product [Rotaria sordida]
MQSSYNFTNLNSGSCWDEPPNPKNNNAHIPNAGTSVQSLQLQLLGIAGVLLVVLVIVLPLTFVLTGIKGNTTLSYSTTIATTLTTITTSTTTLSPYACGNMTFYNNTELGGTDIGG